MTHLYSWERLWCPRSQTPRLDRHGFTEPPSTHPYLEINKHLKRLEDLEAEPVVILLGEPGIGKSKALEQEAKRLRTSNAAHSFVPLDSRDVPLRIFDDPTLKDWMQERPGVKFTFLLDGLDYCRQLLPDIGAQLRNGFRPLPKENLRLRITCRSVEWLTHLEKALCDLWGQDQVHVYYIAPLTAADVKIACEQEQIDFPAFGAEITRIDAGPLASSPITLGLLFKLFREGHRLPHTRWDTYERGCMRLAEEMNPLWQEAAPNAHNSAAKDRFITAGRVAFLSLMTNCPEITDIEASSDQISWEDIIGEPKEEFKGNSFPVKQSVVRDTLNTGLFKLHTGRAYRVVHQTYSEFLAAYYLHHRNVPLRQLIPLFSHPEGGSDFPPQLVATVAWLAIQNREFRTWAVRQDPTMMLQGDVPALPESERADIVKRLLQAAADNRFSAWDVRFSPSLERLDCPGIAECLLPWLDGKFQSANAQTLAISIAEGCKIERVLPSLVELVLDENASKDLRIIAGYAIARYGRPEDRVRMKTLLPVVSSDPEEELRGTALQAMWPDLLKTEELLPLLTMPRRPSLHGAYQGFLSRFVDNIPREDLPYALSWLLNHRTGITDTIMALRDNAESEARFASNPFASPMTQILQRAWHSWDNPALQPLILQYFDAYRAERHTVDFSNLFGDKILTPQEIGDDRRKRRELFVQLLSLENPQEVYPWTLLSVDAIPPLLNEADADWLWQQAAEAGTDERREAYAYCAYRKSSREDGTAQTRLGELCESYPALLSLQEGFSMSEKLQVASTKERDNRDKQAEQQNRRRIQKQQDQIKQRLDAFETGKLDEWPRLLYDIQFQLFKII